MEKTPVRSEDCAGVLPAGRTGSELYAPAEKRLHDALDHAAHGLGGLLVHAGRSRERVVAVRTPVVAAAVPVARSALLVGALAALLALVLGMLAVHGPFASPLAAAAAAAFFPLLAALLEGVACGALAALAAL